MKTDEDSEWLISVRNSIKTLEELASQLDLTEEEKIEITKKLPLRITPYYLELIKTHPVLRRTVVPTINEFIVSDDESNDPLDEDKYRPVKCLVHKYPDRALLLCTNFCSVNCRYCTRSRIFDESKTVSHADLEEAFQYLKEHTEIRDLIISGGDPLTLSDGNLEYVLQKVRAIKHIEIIRIGTKAPVVLPERITPKLVKMLKKYHPLYMSLHFTHPLEITQECSDACTKLADAGIVLRSQTVLLKGINDDIETMKELMHKLLINRISPYYIYQCDRINGSEHFRTSIEKGIEIIRGLRGWTSGYAIPTYIIDTKIGKIALNPDYVEKIEDGNITFKNYKGEMTTINYF